MSPQPCDWVPIGATVVPDGQVGVSRVTKAPVSGRVTSFAVDPADPDHHLFVGTALGGVWETTDGGLTWSTLANGDQQASLAVGALALSGGTLHIGTGEANQGGDNQPGLGLLLYGVAGKTFTQDFAAPFDETSISAVVVAPGPHLFVATNAGLWERVGAAAWAEVPVGGATGLHITGLAFDPTSGYLWVAVQGSGVFVRHPVSGAVVRPPETVARLPQANTGRVSLAMCAQHPGTIYAAFQSGVGGSLQIYRATDAPTAAPANATAAIPSSTWTLCATPAQVDFTFYAIVLGVHPRDGNFVWFGANRLFRSKDGGAHWEDVTEPTATSPGLHADQHAIVVQDGPVTAGSFAGISLWIGNDGGVWRSTDGGTTWAHRNRGLNTMQYFCIASHPTVPTVVVAGAQDNGVQRFSGDGAWALTDYGDGSYVAIDPANPTTWYDAYVSFSQPTGGTYHFTGFKRSDAAGGRDTYRETPGTASINTADRALFYAPFAVVSNGPASAPDIWVGTEQLYLTTDRGQTFTRIASSALGPGTPGKIGSGISAIATAPGHPERVYFGTSEGRLFMIDRPGASWTTGLPAAGIAPTELMAPAPTPPPAPPPAPQSALAAAAAAAGLPAPSFITAVAAVRLSSGQDRVFVAAGRNHISGASAAIANAALYVSDDSGRTFTPAPLPAATATGVAGGIPAEKNSVNAIAIDPADPAIAFVGCDIGVYRYDAGTHAVELWHTGLPNTPVLWLDVFAQAPRLLRAATHGRGVWETYLDAAPAAGCPTADTYLRDIITDAGRDPTPASAIDPFTATAIVPNESIDVVLDVPGRRPGGPTLSTEDFTATGPLDDMGFIALSDLPPAGAQKHDAAKLYVRVHNRGPHPATAVKVAASWADATGTVPDLPAGFFGPFPGGPLAATGGWQSVDGVATIDHIPPGESKIAVFDFTLADVPDKIRVLAAVSSAEDPFTAPTDTDSLAAARTSKRIALHDFDVAGGGSALLVVVLILLGLAVVGGGAYLYYRETHH